MELATGPLILLACGAINYLRGGNLKQGRPDNPRGAFLPEWFPSRPASAVLMGLLVGWLSGNVWLGIAFGAAFFLWAAIGAWGLWITLGRYGEPENPWQPMDEVSWLERTIRKIAGPRPHLALLIRFSVATPMLYGIGYLFGLPALMWVAFVLPFGLVAAYEVAWQLWDRGVTLNGVRTDAIGESEFLAGLVWGAVVVAAL